MGIESQGSLTRAVGAQNTIRPATARSAGPNSEQKNTEDTIDDGNKEEKISRPSIDTDKLLERLNKPVSFPRTADDASRFDALQKDGIVQPNDQATLEARFGLPPSPGFYNQNGQSAQSPNTTTPNTPTTGGGIPNIMPGTPSIPIVNNRPDPWQGGHGAQPPISQPPISQPPATRSFSGEVGGQDGSIAGQLAFSAQGDRITGTYKTSTGEYIEVTGSFKNGSFEIPINGNKIHGSIDERTGSIELAHLDECKECTVEPPSQEPPRIEPDWANRNNEMLA